MWPPETAQHCRLCTPTEVFLKSYCKIPSNPHGQVHDEFSGLTPEKVPKEVGASCDVLVVLLG